MNNQIRDLMDKIDDEDVLKYADKYGAEGKKEEESRWSLDDLTKEQVARLETFAEQDKILSRLPIEHGVNVNVGNHSNRVDVFARVENKMVDPYVPNAKPVVDRHVAKVDIFQSIEKALSMIPVEHSKNINIGNHSERLDVFSETDKKLSGLPVEHGVNIGNHSERLDAFSSMDRKLLDDEAEERQYSKDVKAMWSRTMGFLKWTGLIDGESDIERLATRNRVVQFDGDASAEIGAVAAAKSRMDSANDLLQRKRKALDFIISKIGDAEKEIGRLETENKRIFTACLTERNKQLRNRMLLDKLDNENRILELKGVVKKTKLDHLSDLSTLEEMRKTADSR